jgi:hypothetical protein
MDANDSKHDLIDKYLRGELSAQALDDFTQSLENNSSLKQDVELRKLMVQAIQEHGAVQLKNYIRSKTTQKEIMKVSFRAWYYAAAAVGLILVASTVILLNQPRTTTISNEMVATVDSNSQDTLKKPNTLAHNRAKIEVPTIDAPPRDDEYNFEDPNSPTLHEEGTGGHSDFKNTDGIEVGSNSYSDAVIIASNIPVIPIRIESNLDNAMVMSGETIRANVRKKSDSKDKLGDVNYSKAPSIDSAIAWENTRVSDDDLLKESLAKFKLSFVNTKEALPMVSLNKSKNQESTEVIVYNLPYDNPLILNYNSKYYLKAGEDYYEFNINKSGKQNVSAVTELALIEALNR